MKKQILFLILLYCCSCSNKPKLIGIQPYDEIDSTTINSISESLKQAYDAKIIILTNKTLPKTAFINIKSPRYRADSLLIDLSKNRPDSINYIIGITTKDISTSKRDNDGNIKKPESKYSDWGIFGLGYKPGNSCVISTYRLKNKNLKIFDSRVRKISIHEIGHNLGLDHCSAKKCVMQDAVETIKTVDLAGLDLCTDCYNEIN
ncbi:matrixin family metalloprotease [Winogradskyella sp. 4-2091]|uniref:matrixin family metalloprotease n=1 Tax=Winogradskyella sp. 4-2091 TaxID=3381659 RepID=UPI0038914FB7